MDIQKLLKRLALAQQNPDLGISFSNEELTTVVATFLKVNQKTNELIEKGKIKGADGYTPKAGKDYLTPEQQEQFMRSALEVALAKHDKEIQSRLAQLQNGLDGKDAEITDEMLAEIAEKASKLISLPDFKELMQVTVNASPEEVRNALELLQDEDKLEMSAIKDLDKTLEEIKNLVFNISRGSGGTIGKQQVYGFIRQAVTDGTIPAGGSGLSKQTVSGTINGSNTAFTITSAFTGDSWIILGQTILIEDEHYTVSGTSITYTTAPPAQLSGEPHILYHG